MTRALLPVLAAGRAVAPPPPSPDPVEAGARPKGALPAEASPPRAVFCASRGTPLSFVVLTADGTAVRPASGALAAGEPGYAPTPRRSQGGVTWLRQVGVAEPSRVAVAADRLARALAVSGPAGRGAA